ncbi:MAG: DUF481 domain-containing protein [Planctomycetes bacterium]|nr:DUF481 domain-containing protein [Planctomycetota bacterium]
MAWFLALALGVSPSIFAQAEVDEGEPATPDIVTLRDGSRLHGRIVRVVDGTLVFESEAARKTTLELRFDRVTSIESPTSRRVVLADGTVLVGTISSVGAEGVAVEGETVRSVGIPLERIVAIDPPPKKALTHKGLVTWTGRVTDGNTRTKSTTAHGEYRARTETSRLSADGDWTYAEDEGELSARNADGSLKYDVFLSQRSFVYANALFEGDDFADLNLRTTLGAGLGYQFVDAERDGSDWSFYEEAGISFFDEDFEGSAADDRYVAARLAGRLEWDVVTDRCTLFHQHEAYFGFENQDDINARIQAGIRLRLIENLFATGEVKFRWDNTPVPGNRRADTEYLWGLTYTFSF